MRVLLILWLRATTKLSTREGLRNIDLLTPATHQVLTIKEQGISVISPYQQHRQSDYHNAACRSSLGHAFDDIEQSSECIVERYPLNAAVA